MSWQEITESQVWNDFVTAQTNGSFLQSFEFGSFQQSLGKKIWRLGYKEDILTGICLLIKQTTRFGSFLYIPSGPIVTDRSALDSLINTITQIGRTEHVNFVRFDPRIVNQELDSKLLSLGLKKINSFTQPQCTQVLDLTQDLDTLRKGLSASTRYNIGWVARQGVRVEVSEKGSDIEIFLKLLQETSKRQQFKLHGESDYYQKQFQTLFDSSMAKLYLAYEPEKVGNDVLAGAIVVTFGKTTTYLHAASSSKNPKLRAPYLMQWQIIEDAKNSGSAIYDFWGVAANDNPQDPWSGVTAFKKSFGGNKICYSAPYDLVLSKGYYLDTIVEKARLLLRKWH